MFKFMGLDKGNMWKKSVKMLESKFGHNQSDVAILVSIRDQKLYVIANNEIERIFLISTSKYGYRSRKVEDKNTPLGVFKTDEVSDKNISLKGLEKKLLSKKLSICVAEDERVLGKRATDGPDILLAAKDFVTLQSNISSSTIVHVQL